MLRLRSVRELLHLHRHPIGSSHSLWSRSHQSVSVTLVIVLTSISAVCFTSPRHTKSAVAKQSIKTDHSLVFNFCFLPLIYFFYPETQNLTLEQIDKLFTGGKIMLHWTPSMGEIGDVGEAKAGVVEQHLEKQVA